MFQEKKKMNSQTYLLWTLLLLLLMLSQSNTMIHLYPHSIKLDTNLKTKSNHVMMQLICDPMNLKPRKVRRSGGGGDSSVWVGRSAPTRCPAVPAAPPCSGRRRKRCRLRNETFVPPLKLHLWFLRHCCALFFFFPKMFFFPWRRSKKFAHNLWEASGRHLRH